MPIAPDPAMQVDRHIGTCRDRDQEDRRTSPGRSVYNPVESEDDQIGNKDSEQSTTDRFDGLDSPDTTAEFIQLRLQR